MEDKEVKKRKERGFGSIIVSAIGNLYNKVSQGSEQQMDEDEQLVQYVIEAHEEWQNAQNFFHNVSEDPYLIDHAIYKLEASKARYIYLLKQAKANGIKINL